MKIGELVLLISSKHSYLFEIGKGEMHTEDGVFYSKDLLKKKFGDMIKTNIDKEFSIAKPNIVDILGKSKRLPQIIMPKDTALILAYTGVQSGSLVVDAGTGSGFLAIFIGNYIKPGKVVTYEKDKSFAKIAKENIRNSGLSKFIQLKQKDISKGITEKDVDLITLDMKGSEKIVKHAYKVLKPGGWLVVYSPYIEQVKEVVKEIEKKNFSELKTVENIVREWQVREHTLPMRSGITHTGFLTFARKVK